MSRSNDLADFFGALGRLLRPPKESAKLQWTIRLNGAAVTVVPEGAIMFLLRDTQFVKLQLRPGPDAKGYPGRIDGVPAWSTSDDTVIALTEMSADGLSCKAVAGQPGVAQVNVLVDVDLGEGVQNIPGTLDFQVEPGAATSVEIVAGVPEEQ